MYDNLLLRFKILNEKQGVTLFIYQQKFSYYFHCMNGDLCKVM